MSEKYKALLNKIQCRIMKFSFIPKIASVLRQFFKTYVFSFVKYKL